MKTLALRTLIVSLAAGLLVAPFSQAQALDISVTEDGVVELYETAVLGRNIAQGRSGQGQRGPTDRPSQPTRRVVPAEQRQLRINNNRERVNVGIESKTNPSAPSENYESDRLRIHLPANLQPQETTQENNQQPKVQQLQGNDQATDEASNQAHIERIRQERQARTDEEIEVLRQEDEGSRELILQSRGAQARLKQGAEFILDPETNSVSLTTPSGITHELNHLPDQAIEQMVAAGVITEESQATESGQLAIGVTEDGVPTYQTTVQQEQRLLGLFSRNIPTRVELNDATGEVSTRQIQSTSFIERLLDRLSF